MTQTSQETPASAASAFGRSWSARRKAGLAGLLILGWPGSIALIVGGLAVSFLLFGYWYPYWQIADMDVMIVYQGFILNDGYPQTYIYHPDHLTIVLIHGWFQLLHDLGLLDVIALSKTPPVSDLAGFEHAWTAAVRAARVLSLILAGALVIAFAGLVRRFLGDRQIAVAATFCFAFSSSLVMHARIVRPELLAGGLATIAFLLLLIAARSPGSAFRPLLVGLAAALCTLGIVNKVQVIFLVAALPAAVMLFGSTDSTAGFWRSRRNALVALAAAAVVAAVLAIPAGAMVALGLSDAATEQGLFRPLAFGFHGLYQGALALWIFGAMVAFAAIWRVPAVETVTAMLAVVAGVSLGLLSLDIDYQPLTVLIAVNPLEQMFMFATSSNPELGGTSGLLSGDLFRLLASGFAEVLARRTFVLHTSARPTLVLEWLVIAGAVLAWRRGQFRLFWQVAIILAIVWGVDMISTLRGLHMTYFIFSDPLVVLAAGWLLVNLSDLKVHRFAFPIGVAVWWIHIVVGHAEPVKHVFKKLDSQEVCGWLPHYAPRVERFPFCPPRT